MKALIVEDVAIARKLLQHMLKSYGECDHDTALNDEAMVIEAVKAGCNSYLTTPQPRKTSR